MLKQSQSQRYVVEYVLGILIKKSVSARWISNLSASIRLIKMVSNTLIIIPHPLLSCFPLYFTNSQTKHKKAAAAAWSSFVLVLDPFLGVLQCSAAFFLQLAPIPMEKGHCLVFFIPPASSGRGAKESQLVLNSFKYLIHIGNGYGYLKLFSIINT